MEEKTALPIKDERLNPVFDIQYEDTLPLISTSFFVNSRTLVGCTETLRKGPGAPHQFCGVGAPHQCPLGVGSKLPHLCLLTRGCTFR